MSKCDESLLDTVVEAVRQGFKSRAEVAAACGLTVPKAGRVLGYGIQSQRLRLAGRDRWNSPTYEVSGQPSAVIHEVAGALV